MVQLLKEFLIWVTHTNRLVVVILIVLFLCIGCLYWNIYSLREMPTVTFLELKFSDQEVKAFDVREFEIVKETRIILAKEILKGYAVFSDNSKCEIIFYPQYNVFHFANENQNYRIKCNGMLAYPLS